MQKNNHGHLFLGITFIFLFSVIWYIDQDPPRKIYRNIKSRSLNARNQFQNINLRWWIHFPSVSATRRVNSILYLMKSISSEKDIFGTINIWSIFSASFFICHEAGKFFYLILDEKHRFGKGHLWNYHINIIFSSATRRVNSIFYNIRSRVRNVRNQSVGRPFPPVFSSATRRVNSIFYNIISLVRHDRNQFLLEDFFSQFFSSATRRVNSILYLMKNIVRKKDIILGFSWFGGG